MTPGRARNVEGVGLRRAVAAQKRGCRGRGDGGAVAEIGE